MPRRDLSDWDRINRKYYTEGYRDGLRDAERELEGEGLLRAPSTGLFKPKTKRKLSAWNKFVKANSNKKKFQYANGKLKLKKMGIAYRKKKR